MIAVDVRNPVEVKAAGERALREMLGVDIAAAFMRQYFGGRGDYTKERQNRQMTDEECQVLIDAEIAASKAAGVWEE